MVRILFVSILVILACLFVVSIIVFIQNLVLNIRLKKYQANRSYHVISSKLSFNLVIVVILLLSPIFIFNNRNQIYMSLYTFNVHGDCIDIGDESYTPEDTLEYMNYISLVVIKDNVHSELFDILDDNDFPLPHEIDVYTYTEIQRLKGEIGSDYLYNLNYLEKEGVYVTDICDFVLELDSDTVFLIIGNYAESNGEVDNFENGAYVLKAVELENYDISKTYEDQSQDVKDLIEMLSLGYVTSETEQ